MGKILKPQAPPTPPAPPPPPSPVSPDPQVAKDTQAKLDMAADAERRSKGRASTLLTAPEGLDSVATTSKRSLLGA